MTWPFENDTSAITKKLAKKSLQSEKRRNLMVVIAVALAAFLICFTGIVSTSLTQMQRNQVVDTYEAVWLGVEENDIETLKGLPEFERVGGYYMLGEELSEQGYPGMPSPLTAWPGNGMWTMRSIKPGRTNTCCFSRLDRQTQ